MKPVHTRTPVHTASAAAVCARSRHAVDPYLKAAALVTMGFATFACARYIDATPVVPAFVRVDGTDDTYVAIKNVRWVKKRADSLYLCTNALGCHVDHDDGDKWKISAAEHPESYKLVEHMVGPGGSPG